MTYLIVYNHNTIFKAEDIHNYMTHMQGITDWWHYLPNVYMVTTSTKNSKNIADMIRTNLPSLLFFVVKVDLSDHNGILNKGAWEWINNKIRGVLRLKPVQNPTKGLADLLSTLPPITPTTPKVQTGNKTLDDILNKLK